jgi:hypothetical protein
MTLSTLWRGGLRSRGVLLGAVLPRKLLETCGFALLAACGGGGGSGGGTVNTGPSPNPVPAISSLSPASATASGISFTLTVNGSNFVSTSQIQWNGGNLTTTYVNASQLTASVTAADIATAGTAKVTVVNPAPGGGTSTSAAFTTNNPTPTVGSLFPSATTVGAAAFTLNVYGSNFVSGATVQWGASNRTTSYVSSSQLAAQITAADVAGAGTSPVTVVNPAPGAGTSGATNFTINAQVSCPNGAGAAVSVCISNAKGMPRLIINGVPTPPLMFFGNIQVAQSQYQLLTQEIKLAAASGIHLYKFTTNVPWTGTDYTYDDNYLQMYLTADPSAMILLEINMQIVDELGTFSVPAGNDILYQNGTTSPISMASNFYFNAFQSALVNAINHYESSPFAGHIIGYWIGAGATGEWFDPNYRTLGLDYSPVNLAAFQQWLTNKYSTNAALSTAWGQQVTLATAAIPVPAAGRFPMTGATQGQAITAFYTPTVQQNWVDYSTYFSQLTSNRLLTLAQAAKQTMQSHKLVGAYFGYIFDLPGSMGGHLNTSALLSSPNIDVLGAPISYINPSDRLLGGAGGSMSAVDSIALHGKLWINEDDLYTWLGAESGLPQLNSTNGVPPTQGFGDTNNILQRNLASALIHRAGTYWMDLNGNGAFNDSNLWLIMSQYGIPRYTDLYNNPAAYSPDVAVLVDENSAFYQQSDWDFLYSPRSLLRNMIVKSGARVGFYYLSDFLNGTLPKTKVYVFANSAYLTDAQVAQIRARLVKENGTAIWQHAPGFLGGSLAAGAAATSALTGIGVTEKDGYPGTAGVGELAGISWGFGAGGQNMLSPRLVINDSQATALGGWTEDQTVNSARKSTGFTSVLLGDFALGNPDMWRPLLSEAAVPIWDSGDDVLLSDGRTLVVHAASNGTKTINLPALLVDASTGQSTISVSMQLGDTQWFTLTQTQ